MKTSKAEAKNDTEGVDSRPEILELGDTTAVANDAAETDPKPTRSSSLPLTEPLRRLQADEDNSLAVFMRSIGAEEGAFRIELHRVSPETAFDTFSGRDIQCSGHLKRYEQMIDEELVAQHHGGGKMRIKVMRPDAKGRFVFYKAKDFTVAGEPKLDALRAKNPLAPAKETAPAANGDSPGIVKEVMGVMKDQLEQANRRAERPQEQIHHDNNAQMLDALRLAVAPLQAQIVALMEQSTAKDKLIADLQNKPVPTDTFKEGMLTHFMTKSGDQVQATRIAYEAEIRTIKDGQSQQESRLRDGFERDKQYITMQHEREIQGLRMSHEIALGAIKSSNDTQIRLLEGTVRTLERQIDAMTTEVKELRAKKEKGIIETMKDVQAIREAIGGDEDEKSTGARIIEAVTDPGNIAAIAGIIGGKGGAPNPQQQAIAAQQAHQAQIAQQQQRRPQVVDGPDGQKYLLQPNGQLTGPIRKKKKRPVVGPDGVVEPELPEIDPATVTQVITMLENAFSGGQEPEIVAQSFAPHIPEEVKITLRDHGVDVFMSKVAKLQSSSPLSSQAGKNWLRKVAERLIG